MEKEFKAINFIKFSVDFVGIMALIQAWEDWRCAGGYEDVYDMQDKEDFMYFVEMYGVDKAIKYYNEHRFYLSGMDFKEPIVITNQYAIDFINDVYDEEHFCELYKLGWFDTDFYKKYFDTKRLVKYIEDNCATILESMA